MFTLFFGGDTFAPSKTYNGESIQQFLQTHFINCFAHMAQRLSHLEAVLGFEVMNEPHPGYIGLQTLTKYDSAINLIFGDSPTALQALALGDGIPQEVDVYVKSWPIPTKKSHSRMINESKTSAWLEGHGCIWRDHGVWGLDGNGQPKLFNDKYFAKHPETGEPISFYNDFYFPFVNAYARAIQNVRQEWFCFVEPLPNEVSDDCEPLPFTGSYCEHDLLISNFLVQRLHQNMATRIIRITLCLLHTGMTLTACSTKSSKAK